jgi:hypothetical protein
MDNTCVFDRSRDPSDALLRTPPVDLYLLPHRTVTTAPPPLVSRKARKL